MCHLLNVMDNSEKAASMGHYIRGKVSGAGRVVLPSELRREFGIEDGTVVVFSRNEYGIQVATLDQMVRRAQEICARYTEPGNSIVDEMIRERRAEAARE
jgi:bifunctional DNA-binding transcriptional regulator/antitoxin component of YhaV-PrlF toxin-antitoxin module